MTMKGESGLVGGVVPGDPTLRALSESDSDVDEVVEVAELILGRISGALYDSMFVVDISWTGAEILFLIELTEGELLWALPLEMTPSAASRSSRLCFTRRLVKARVIDMVGGLLLCVERERDRRPAATQLCLGIIGWWW